MSTTYDGDPDENPTSITLPSDGDAPTVSSVNPAFEGLMNKARHVLDGATTFTNEKSFGGPVNFDAGIRMAVDDADAPLIDVPAGSNPGRVLLWSFPTSAATSLGRIYARAASTGLHAGWEFTTNAVWSNDDDEWSADNTGAPAEICQLFGGPNSGIFDGDGTPLMIRRKGTTTVAWTDATWDSDCVGFGIGDPSAGIAPPKGVMFRKSMPVAWGVVETDGVGGVTLTDSFNVDDGAISIVGNDVRVVLERSMGSVNYVVSVTSKNKGSPLACYEVVGSLEFDIRWTNGSFTAFNAAAVILGAGFVVFGEVA